MRLQFFVVLTLLGLAAAKAIAVPDNSLHADHDAHELWKRKGGGGGGGRGGGGGKSGGSRSSGSSGSRSGSSSSGGSKSGGSSGSRGGSSSVRGSGPTRSFGGGFYGGGAKTPYKAGGRSPSGIVPVLAVGALLTIWPAVWLYGAYHYPYTNPYRFRNETANEDQTLPIICGCDPYQPCACDEPSDTTYLAALVGTGAYDQLDKSIITVTDVNSTRTLLINGTLPNGTTAAATSTGASMNTLASTIGYWPMVALACAAVFVGA